MIKDVQVRLGSAIDTGLGYLRSAQGRLLAGVSMASALAWFLWPARVWSFDAKAFIALGVAVFTWLASVASERPNTGHDVALLQKFRETLDSDQITFLRRHDFSVSFERRWLNGVFSIDGKWEGADFRFDDPKLDREFIVLVDQIVNFARLVAYNTWPLSDARDLSTAVPQDEYDGDYSERTAARVDALNNESTQLVDAVDSFVLRARRHLARQPG